jgi:hypothetical protein
MGTEFREDSSGYSNSIIQEISCTANVSVCRMLRENVSRYWGIKLLAELLVKSLMHTKCNV